MCILLLPPGVKPIAVNKYIKLQEEKDAQYTEEAGRRGRAV